MDKSDIKKKVGRPRLSDEEKQKRKEEKDKTRRRVGRPYVYKTLEDIREKWRIKNHIAYEKKKKMKNISKI